MFRKMPILLLAMILVIGIAHSWIPLTVKSTLYGISLSLKSVIIFILPFLVFGLLFKTAVQWTKKASKWILVVLVTICVSNFLSTMMSYCFGSLVYRLDLTLPAFTQVESLTPTAQLSLPKLIENSHAMFAALLLGIVFGWLKPAWAEKIALRLDFIVQKILKAFLYMIPVFIIGFVVKMLHEGTLHFILSQYALVGGVIAGAVFLYIGVLYFLIAGGNRKVWLQSIKNMFPAMIAGFGSMSSATAMPLTIIGTDKNTNSSDIARSTIPATVNIHLIGDCFSIPIFAFAVMKSFGVAEPAFMSYLIFALYFVLAKFSVAAIPGGGIMVMLPVLEAYLGFNGEMLSLMTALYILFDPLITSANVLGNGGFAMGIGKLAEEKKHEQKTESI